jgi:hypothetical protein
MKKFVQDKVEFWDNTPFAARFNFNGESLYLLGILEKGYVSWSG